MECKDNTVRTWFRTIGSINRNIVECKAIIPQAWNSLMSVLIETLWNVKMELTRRCRSHDVLIETLWNVKNDEKKGIAGINVY